MTDVNFIQILLVFIVAFIAGIDQFSFLESIYQPIVMGPVIGAILGNFELGLVVGGTYQLITIGAMPIGGAQPPNAVIGGIMASIFACTASPAIDASAAVAMAIPFSVLGTNFVTLLFTLMSGLMKLADKAAENANPKGIVNLNYLGMLILGASFGVVCVAGLMAGSSIADAINSYLPAFFMDGLAIAGKMMPFVGFAILMKVMLSGEYMGFFFAGFAMAAYVKPDMLFIGFIGLAIAIFYFQISSRQGSVAVATNGGGEEDGI